LIAADFNRDGRPDLAWAESGSGNVSVLLGLGDGTFLEPFSFPAAFSPIRVTTADFNNDGSPDLAVLSWLRNTASVLLGNGDGTFQNAVQFAAGLEPIAITAGDFDNDGRPDLAVANSLSQDVSLLTGKGDGTFDLPRHYSAGETPMDLAWADFDRDGQPDLAIGGLRRVSILIGNRCPTSPGQQVADLIASVAHSGAPAGTLQSLLASLSAAESALARGNGTAACNELRAFIQKVEAQAGKKLTRAQAVPWITAASGLRALLDCR
jgi:hypothetical protein